MDVLRITTTRTVFRSVCLAVCPSVCLSLSVCPYVLPSISSPFCIYLNEQTRKILHGHKTVSLSFSTQNLPSCNRFRFQWLWKRHRLTSKQNDGLDKWKQLLKCFPPFLMITQHLLLPTDWTIWYFWYADRCIFDRWDFISKITIP